MAKTWRIVIPVHPDEVDDVKEAYAEHFGKAKSRVTRKDISDWFNNIVDAEIETIAFSAESRAERERQRQEDEEADSE